MEIIIGILQLVGWIVIGFAVMFTVTFVRIFFKELEKAKSQDLDKELSSSMLVYIEKVKDSWHMYDAVTNFFVAQGKDEKELWEQAQIRCPDMNIVIGNVTVSDGVVTVSSEKIREQK